jgi:hypothetical protein
MRLASGAGLIALGFASGSGYVFVGLNSKDKLRQCMRQGGLGSKTVSKGQVVATSQAVFMFWNCRRDHRSEVKRVAAGDMRQLQKSRGGVEGAVAKLQRACQGGRAIGVE